MREVAIRVRARDVEAVLDRVLPLVPGGVHERAHGHEVELVMRGAELPELGELRRALGRVRARLTERVASDDWRERRRADYVPVSIGGRLLVRPPWAPGLADSGLDADATEIVLEAGGGFGAGTHPTTRACLELLLESEPAGAFADFGCGTGVLAILAARLGWSPVIAVDLSERSVAAAAANARRNGVTITARAGDVTTPGVVAPAAGVAANVPPAVHQRVAELLAAAPPQLLLISGFGPESAAEVLGAYGKLGYGDPELHDRNGWIVARLRRGSGQTL